MSGKNQVTLTFAGDSEKLEKTFSNVGAASKKMSDEVGKSGEGFHRAAEGFDVAEKRARGFRDVVTGTQDTVKGFGSILKGEFTADSLLTAGAGVADLAGGFSNLLVPAMKSAVTWLGNTKVAQLAASAASSVWTGVQWLLNAALSANPIGIIIIGIGLLVAAIVLIATKTTWFQTAWNASWGWIKKTAVDVWEWLKALPDKLGDVFKSVAHAISSPFITAFNFIADGWNSTVGSFTVPDWIPGLGGKSAPKMPHLVAKFHEGGVVPGVAGSEMLAILQAGETVTPAGQAAPVVLELRSSGTSLDDLLLEIVRRAIKARGGNVQLVLGRN